MKIISTILVLTSFVAAAQQNHASLIDNYMSAQASVHEFSGAVLVAKKGEILYQKAFGLANREWNIPNTADTRFPIASLTKQFTAAAILRLEEQGKLSTSDKLSKYFPHFPKADSITIHMLLNHTSGIHDLLQDSEFADINPNLQIGQLNDSLLVNIFKDKPFDFAPGTFWRYSNSGYILLGYLIQKTSGISYRDYIQKNLLQKANMTNTDLFRFDTILPRRASGYSRMQHLWQNSRIININISFATGGLFSTVGDLFIWRKALNSGTIISEKSLRKMNTPNHEDRGYGYGVFIDKANNRRTIFHSGRLLGFSSFMIEYPDDDIQIIILTNRETNLDFIPKGLAGILFGKSVTPTYNRKPFAINKSDLTAFTGEFQSDEIPFPVNITSKNGKLFLFLGRDIELVPESENKFFIDEPDVEIQIEFETSSKQVTHAYFIEGGLKTEVRRTVK